MLNHRSSDLGIPAVSQHLSGLVLALCGASVPIESGERSEFNAGQTSLTFVTQSDKGKIAKHP
jgi:hypothetical protein